MFIFTYFLFKWNSSILLILAFLGIRFVEAERIRASVITMQMQIAKKHWPGQKRLHLEPYFSLDAPCYQLLFAIGSLNNDLRGTVFGCRSRPAAQNNTLLSIYTALPPLELKVDSQNSPIRGGIEKLLKEWKETVSKHFEIGSDVIHIRTEDKAFYVQAQRLRTYLEKDGANFSSRTNDWTKSYKREAATFITQLLKQMDSGYPLIHVSMSTEKGTSYLYSDIDLMIDVTEIEEIRPEAIGNLSNEISAASRQQVKLGSFEEKKHRFQTDRTNFQSVFSVSFLMDWANCGPQ